jgi:transcription-repair coupling factor (superfamily II helicase)
MSIRGFGNIFGEQQTGDVGNVGIDLFFEMLFESLSKVNFDSRYVSSYVLLVLVKIEVFFCVNCWLKSENLLP